MGWRGGGVELAGSGPGEVWTWGGEVWTWGGEGVGRCGEGVERGGRREVRGYSGVAAVWRAIRQESVGAQFGVTSLQHLQARDAIRLSWW